MKLVDHLIFSSNDHDVGATLFCNRWRTKRGQAKKNYDKTNRSTTLVAGFWCLHGEYGHNRTE